MKKQFTISAEMEERWVPTFISMLNTMEKYGNIGHSEMLGFFADGDGDFRPKFRISLTNTSLSDSDLREIINAEIPRSEVVVRTASDGIPFNEKLTIFDAG